MQANIRWLASLFWGHGSDKSSDKFLEDKASTASKINNCRKIVLKCVGNLY